ncbi:MAG TPA: D-aminoacyl-tRNA deacylase [Dehalococcoidia bacterium]|nr:D-aminoacyl-tRNA deacylase [Dehalococcoidia bacterium]
MRALIQRVAQAWVEAGGQEVGRIGRGLVVLLGVAEADTEDDARYLVDKISHLRIFSDEQNRFNRSALDVGAEFLVVSQFTLYADTRRGRLPDFTQAAAPQKAQQLYLHAVELFRSTGLKVDTGQFQEYMQVHLQNDGPVTLMLDSSDHHRSRRD